MYGNDTNLKGIRMDVEILENQTEMGRDTDSATEEEQALVDAIYDVEMEKKAEKQKELPWRTRYYHSKLDGRHMRSGAEYEKLPDCYVIFISNFDPFGMDRILYTVKNGCVEAPEMPYDDGARTLFFYTRGKVGDVPDVVQTTLNYIENSNAKNAVDNDLKILDEIVSGVKTNQKEVERYMVMMRSGEEIYQEGHREGHREGHTEGRSDVNQLNIYLSEAGRSDDILRAAQDAEYQDMLMREFGIRK